MVLSVIIVNYNVKFYLEQCLYSVLRAGRSIDMEIIVVDNQSSDGSRDYLVPAFPQVRFIWNTENLGFAKACNIGLQRAGAPYILFLNPDVIVGENCFDHCLRFLRETDHCGALGIRMINERGVFLKESKRGFPSPLVSLFRLTGLSALFPQSALFARYYLGHLPEGETSEVDVVAGAFMMIKKEILEEVGGFDESFFMYGEDIDLSYRIQKQGYKNYYYPEVTILHFKGRSTPRKDLQYLKMFYDAMKVFVKKHYGKPGTGFLHLFLQAGIRLRIMAARMALYLPKIRQQRKNKADASYQKILVVGIKEEDAEHLQHMVLFRYGKTQPGLIFLPVEQGVEVSAQRAAEILSKERITKMVLCEGALTFADMIAFCERITGVPVPAGIHARGSRGIAGAL